MLNKLNSDQKKIRNYRIIIESAVQWESRETFLELTQSFVRKEMDGDTFESKFLELERENNRKIKKIREAIEEDQMSIPDFYYSSKSKEFVNTLSNIFFALDSFEPDQKDWNDYVYSESQLRFLIQEAYLPILQESCKLEDSF
jgi:type III secretory pathway component EscV